MKKISFTFLGLLLTFKIVAQDAPAYAVIKEGRKLYRSEKASWLGTDLFLAQAREKANEIGGYLSYTSGNSTRCIFFSKAIQPTVLSTITFDSTFKAEAAELNKTERPLTVEEESLVTMRQSALKEIRSSKLFKMYEGMNFNLIPISDELGKRVYILSGSKQNGIVLFGNDYLISFNQKNNIVSKKALHNNLIPFDYTNKPENAVAGMHILCPPRAS